MFSSYKDADKRKEATEADNILMDKIATLIKEHSKVEVKRFMFIGVDDAGKILNMTNKMSNNETITFMEMTKLRILLSSMK